MGRSHRRAAPPAWAGSVAGVEAIDTHRGRIAAPPAGALAAERARSSPGTALEMLAVAESLASTGSFEVDDLRRRGLTGPPADGPVGLLVRVLPFGLSTPLDRPRLRRDAYRCAAAAHPPPPPRRRRRGPTRAPPSPASVPRWSSPT